MLDTIASFCVRRARLVLAVAALAVIAAALVGGGAAARLSNGGTTDPSADSSLAANALSQHFASGTPNLVLVATADAGVDSPSATAAGQALAERLAAEPGVQGVASYWQDHSAELRSGDSRSALITAHLTGSDNDVAKRIATLEPRLQSTGGALRVQVTGAAEIRREADDQIKKDLAKAELFAVPLILICLLFVFRGLIAALLPLVIGAVSIPGTMFVLRLLTMVTPVSVFAMNLTTALGLGLGIDYSLLVVRRYREELNRRQGAPDAVPDAIRAALRTAGRTVVISALTVAGAMAALLVFPLYFLRSFAYAGSAVVLLAALAVVVVLPALLAVVGYRINALNVTHLFRRRASATSDDGKSAPAPSSVPSGRAWWILAMAVMRRPLAVAIAVTAALVVLALPFRHVSFGLADDRVLPTSAQAHVAAQTIRDDFGSVAGSSIQIYASNVPSTDSLAAYATRLSALPGVDRVESAAGTFAAGHQATPPVGTETAMSQGSASWLQLVPTVAASQSTDTLVRAVRVTTPSFPVLVGGAPAQLLDTKSAVEHDLPLAVGIIAAVTFVLMFLLTGSVLVPVKALILNLLSLTATFGSLVWVFQYGHLRFLLGDFQTAGFLDLTIPILMFCVSFGMSMDYEAALMSRIREEWDRTGDNSAAIAGGLRATGGLITAAAVLLSIVLVAIGESQVVNTKMLGMGLALAVIMDATVVRCLLVPAVMRLAGSANWWAPRPLLRVYRRFGISAEGALGEDASTVSAQPAYPAPDEGTIPRETAAI